MKTAPQQLHEILEGAVIDSGLWQGSGRQTHAFLLSPSLYEIDRSQAEEFNALAPALDDCLRGLGRIYTISATPGLASGKIWKTIFQILNHGVPKTYNDLQHLNPSRVPAVLKVDFMRTDTGQFQIAEIDGHNKHGMGYQTLAGQLRQLIAPDHHSYPGIVEALARSVESRSKGQNRLLMLYGDQERFYLPEFSILQAALTERGIEMLLANELELEIVNGEIRRKGSFMPSLLVDFPFLYKNVALRDALIVAYQEGKINFLIPPKPFFGSKGLLAILRNDEKNAQLEAILNSHIKPATLELVRSYIPETTFLNSSQNAQESSFCGDSPFVLKEVIASGMKGTIFSTDDNYERVMHIAKQSPNRFVLQREIQNQPHRFSYFENGECCEADFFVRATAHFVDRKVADIVATARQDKKVHGAKDCLQLGTIIV